MRIEVAMPMLLVYSVRCNGCGAPLQIPQAARFITCQHCQAELQIEQTSDVVYTKVIEEVQKHVDETQKQLTRLAVQQMIDRLDSEWDNTRREILGSESEANMGRHNWIFLFPAAAIVAMFGTAISSQDGAFTFIAIYAAVLLLIGFSDHRSKQHRYSEELATYRRRRLELEGSISHSNSKLRNTNGTTRTDMIHRNDPSFQ